MFVLIVVGFLYGSALGIRAEAIMTVHIERNLSETTCKAIEVRINAIIAKVGRGGEAFCVKDG